MTGSAFATTSESEHRLELARTLAAHAPAETGEVIAVTGSVGRGWADAHSDVELNAWAESPPAPEMRRSWLLAAGAQEVQVETDALDDSELWATCRYGHIWFEIGWQTCADAEAILHALVAGEETSHSRLLLADVVLNAVPLRGGRRLARWHDQLTAYPNALQTRLLRSVIELWSFPNWVGSRWALVERGETMALSERLLWDAHSVLRLLFALNQRWEPNWKWIERLAEELPISPPRLAERLDAIFTKPEPEARLLSMLDLIEETLAFVPPSRDVSRALRTIRDSRARRAP